MDTPKGDIMWTKQLSSDNRERKNSLQLVSNEIRWSDKNKNDAYVQNIIYNTVYHNLPQKFLKTDITKTALFLHGQCYKDILNILYKSNIIKR